MIDLAIGYDGRTHVSLANLAQTIKGLCATDTSDPNVEYERACAEVFCEVSGRSFDFIEDVAAALGLRIEGS